MRNFVALTLVAGAAAAPTVSHGSIHGDAAPVLSSLNAEVIPGSYIVKFKDHVTEASASDHHGWIQQLHSSSEQERLELRKRSQIPIVDTVYQGLKHTFQLGGEFLGYSGHFGDDVIEKVRRHPDVEYIEHDSLVHTMSVPEASESCDGEIEKTAPWGLARISHRDALSFSTFNKYLYSKDGGEGVDVYVVDTGTSINHADFEGRAKWGKTIPAGDEDRDGNGHGTHCSGTIAGKKFGVAKKAHVYAVKVLRSNGSGSMSDVIAGVEWAAHRHLEQVKAAKEGRRKGFRGSVANMSLGGGKTRALDDVVNAAVGLGVHFAVAAGNDNADACNYSPAAATRAVTVGASGLDDSRAYFSNYGQCTDIFAPGLNILSTWIGSNHATNTISGTSMASPHICGLLAYYLSLQPSEDSEYSVAPITPEKLKSNMLSIATVDALDDMPQGTPNLLAWNGGGCSNYSAIIEAGSHEIERAEEEEEEMAPVLDIEEDIQIISGKVVTGISRASHKIEKFSKKFHDALKLELEDLFDELAA